MFEKLQYAARLNDNGSYPYLRSHPLNSKLPTNARPKVRVLPVESVMQSRCQTFFA